VRSFSLNSVLRTFFIVNYPFAGVDLVQGAEERGLLVFADAVSLVFLLPNVFVLDFLSQRVCQFTTPVCFF